MANPETDRMFSFWYTYVNNHIAAKSNDWKRAKILYSFLFSYHHHRQTVEHCTPAAPRTKTKRLIFSINENIDLKFVKTNNYSDYKCYYTRSMLYCNIQVLLHCFCPLWPQVLLHFWCIRIKGNRDFNTKNDFYLFQFYSRKKVN